MNTRFSAVLIDWRLFENTYLGLNDIKVPIEEFERLEQLPKICSDLQREMLSNLVLNPKTEEEKLLRRMWELFTEDEKEAFELRHNPNSKDVFVSTEDKVRELCNNFKFNPDFTDSWQPLLEKLKSQMVRNMVRHCTY